MSITNFNATTPQLKAVKKLFEAYLSLDIKNIEPHIAKDFKFQTFPKIADLPDEAKGTHAERYGPAFALMTKAEAHVHEAIEAPGKVVMHFTGVMHTVDGNVLDYDTVQILTLVEEDGELKVTDYKDFADPEKRANLHAWAAKVLAKRAT